MLCRTWGTPINKSASRCAALPGENRELNQQTKGFHLTVDSRTIAQIILPFNGCWKQYQTIMAALRRINVPKQTPADMRLVSVHLWRLLSLRCDILKTLLQATSVYTHQDASSLFFFPTHMEVEEWEARGYGDCCGATGESQTAPYPGLRVFEFKLSDLGGF